MTLAESNTSYVEAKARLLSDSQLSPGAFGIFRIQGYWYNEFRSPGSGQDYNGYEGDVFVQLRLQYDSDGTLRARANVGRSDGANEDPWTTLFSQDFSTPIQFDTDYIISIEYKDSQLIFKCNNETITYTITTSEYVPYGEHRALRTRIYLDPGESGYMKAQFDDVYIDTDVSDGGVSPDKPTLSLPVNGAMDVSLTPTLQT